MGVVERFGDIADDAHDSGRGEVGAGQLACGGALDVVADAEPEAISIVVCVGFLTGGLRLAAILVSGLQVLVRGAAVSLGEIAGQ